MGYDDHPDGQECFHKMACVGKYAAYTGFYTATMDVLMITKPQGYVLTANRYLKHMGLALACTATFVGGACAVAALRKKNDHYNYITGGVLTGSLLGEYSQFSAYVFHNNNYPIKPVG